MQAVHTANGIIRAGLAIWRTGQIPVGPPRGGGTTHTHSPTHTRARRTHISPDSSSPSLSAFRPRCRRGVRHRWTQRKVHASAEQGARGHVLPRNDECFLWHSAAQRGMAARALAQLGAGLCALALGEHIHNEWERRAQCHRAAVYL